MNSSLRQLLIALLFLSPSLYAQKSFNQSKGVLKQKVYPKKGVTFYCACPYQKNSIKLKKCQLNLKKHRKRQKRLEWEHVVPVSSFGHAFKAYREAKTICKRSGKKALSPRKCAARKDVKFKHMMANLHNLVPVVGAINALRSNYSFEEGLSGAKELCAAGFKIKDRKVEPPNNVKGDIARIYHYMDQRYPGLGIIGKKRRQIFEKWNLNDPPDENECLIHALKAKLQGEANPFLEAKCKGMNKSQ